LQGSEASSHCRRLIGDDDKPPTQAHPSAIRSRSSKQCTGPPQQGRPEREATLASRPERPPPAKSRMPLSYTTAAQVLLALAASPDGVAPKAPARPPWPCRLSPKPSRPPVLPAISTPSTPWTCAGRPPPGSTCPAWSCAGPSQANRPFRSPACWSAAAPSRCWSSTRSPP